MKLFHRFIHLPHSYSMSLVHRNYYFLILYRNDENYRFSISAVFLPYHEGIKLLHALNHMILHPVQP